MITTLQNQIIYNGNGILYKTAKLLMLVAVVLLSNTHNTLGNELLELGCTDALECHQYQQENTNASCVAGHCQCTKPGNVTVPCAPEYKHYSNIIGLHCPCTISHSQCIAKYDLCFCDTGYMPSKDRRRCLPKSVPLNKTCELDAQCQSYDSYAMCGDSEKVCQCPSGFDLHNRVCASFLADVLKWVYSSYCECNDTKCLTDDDCRDINGQTECSLEHFRCVCGTGYVTASNNSSCIAAANYGENCTESTQCKYHLGPGGVCNVGLCQCDPTYEYIAPKFLEQNSTRVCARTIEIGEICRTDEDCYIYPLPKSMQTMQCSFYECGCLYGYISINNSMCIKGISHTTQLRESQFLIYILLISVHMLIVLI